MVRQQNANENQRQPPSAPSLIPDQPPDLPFPFRPSIPDQKYYRLGEDELQGCLRDAIKEAGRERWYELTSNGGWTDFLIESRDQGLVGHDSNHDANEVKGLLDKVRDQAIHDNPKLDRATNDTLKCTSVVKRFATKDLLDEVILTWAVGEGHLKDLPPTKPQPERRNVIADPDVSDGDEHQILIKVGHGAIGFFPKGSHVPTNMTVPDNSALSGNSPALDVLEYILDHLFGEKPTFPGNWTAPDKWTPPGKLTIPLVVPSHILIPGNYTLHDFIIHILDQLKHKNPTGPFNPTLPVNSTSHGRLPLRRSLNSASNVMARDDSDHPSFAENIFSAVDDQATQVVQLAALADPEISKIFGHDPDRMKSFFGQPLIRDLMHAATKRHHKNHKHHKHGKHGKEDKDSVWADPDFVSKFIKDTAEGMTNAAQLVGGIAKIAEHKSHSKHESHAKP